MSSGSTRSAGLGVPRRKGVGPRALARYVFAATLVRSADGGAVVAIVLLAHACGMPGWLSALLRASITARHLLGPFIARRLATARDGRKVIAFSAVLHGCSSGPQRRSCRSQHSQQLLRPPAPLDRWGFTSPEHGTAPSFGKEKNRRNRAIDPYSSGFVGGAEGTRTPDPLHAMQVRYQLRHSPKPSPPGVFAIPGSNLTSVIHKWAGSESAERGLRHTHTAAMPTPKPAPLRPLFSRGG